MNKPNPKITAVIFDMDGVIFDTESLWRKAFLAANKKFNVDITEKYRQGMCGKNEKLVREELRVHRPSLDVDAYRDFMLASVNHDISVGAFEVKPFFKETISYLKEKGIKIALATSSHKVRAENLF
ncbi:MAG: HAD family phosphatase, partial [Bacilli bacterium]|nr:HAD family phosphatase [Bacilli bacterium]